MKCVFKVSQNFYEIRNDKILTYDGKVTAEMSKPSSLVWYTIER